MGPIERVEKRPGTGSNLGWYKSEGESVLEKSRVKKHTQFQKPKWNTRFLSPVFFYCEQIFVKSIGKVFVRNP